MTDLSLRRRILQAATRLTAKLFPKPIKSVALKNKKLRVRKFFVFHVSTTTTSTKENMPPKKEIKKSKTTTASSAPAPLVVTSTNVGEASGGGTSSQSVEEHVQAIETKLKDLSLTEKEDRDLGQSTIKPPPKSEEKMESGFAESMDVKGQYNEKDRTRFDGYNDRLEELLKIRERLAKQGTKQTIPPQIEIILREIQSRSDAEVTQARDDLDNANYAIDKLEKDNDALNNKLNKLLDDLEKEKKKNKDLEANLQRKQDELDQEIERREHLQAQAEQQNAEKEDQRRKERDDLQATAKVLQQQLSTTDNMLRLQEAQIANNDAALQARDEEIQAMYHAFVKLQEDFENALHSKVDELEEIFRRNLDSFKKNNEAADAAKDAKIKALLEQVPQLEQRVADLIKENAELQTKLQNSGQDKENKDQLVADLQQRLDNMAKKYNDLANDLRGAEVKLALTLEPQFQRYNGLLTLEEKRLDATLRDDNNNAKA